MRLGLRDLGFIEGRNLTIDFRWAEGRNDRFPSLAAELIALNPDAIVADSTPGALAAKRATGDDSNRDDQRLRPGGVGACREPCNPGGNVTGVTDYGNDLAVKGLELLHAVAPKAARIAVLMSDNPVHPFQLKQIQEAAKALRLTIVSAAATSSDKFEDRIFFDGKTERRGANSARWRAIQYRPAAARQDR
jgi:putative tryptophan/tyrosine transport system substrate-binding protein